MGMTRLVYSLPSRAVPYRLEMAKDGEESQIIYAHKLTFERTESQVEITADARKLVVTTPMRVAIDKSLVELGGMRW
jgi:hypothetical protein